MNPIQEQQLKERMMGLRLVAKIVGLLFHLIWVLSIISYHPFFQQGFYYKTFMGPKGFWKKIYEPLIRRTAGLGKPPKNFRSKSIHQNHNVDILIVGAGLTGLIAARKLIDTEHEVLLVEQDSFLGGILKNSNKIKKIDGKKPYDWINETEELIKKSKNIKILKDTLVTTYNFTNHLIALEDKFLEKK